MVSVNENSKKVLDKISELIKRGDGYLKLNNDQTFMPLTAEETEENVLSLCHYGEQNGDLMRDPEMLFWKDGKGNYSPFYYRNDYMGVERFAGEVLNNVLVISDDREQSDQTEFANTWLVNIRLQQGIQI